MKYIFKPCCPITWKAEGYKWFEKTTATPRDMHNAAFSISDLRRWFLRWVFKAGS